MPSAELLDPDGDDPTAPNDRGLLPLAAKTLQSPPRPSVQSRRARHLMIGALVPCRPGLPQSDITLPTALARSLAGTGQGVGSRRR